MNILPLELLQMIFEYLDLTEVIRLKLVCKRFNAFISNGFLIKELHYYERDYLKWFYKPVYWPSARSRNHNNWISPLFGHANLALLRGQLFNIGHLKYLCIDVRPSLVQFEDINKLVTLESLIVECPSKHTTICDSHHRLTLPNLKCLKIKTNHRQLMQIDSPIEALWLDSDEMQTTPQFRYPKLIKHLMIKCSLSEIDDKFPNLEHLSVGENFMSNIYSEIQLCEIMNRLKLLKEFVITRLRRGNELNLKQLMIQKSKLYRSDLKINFLGFNLTTGNEFDGYSQSGQDYWGKDFYCILKGNFKKLDENVHWKSEINFTKIMDCIYEIDFFRKFTNVLQLTVDAEYRSQDELTKFISECKNLEELIVQCDLEQSFFDQIPQISSLFALIIKNTRRKSLDFHFVTMMSHLALLDTDLDLVMTSELRLDKLNNVEILRFRIRQNYIIIRKQKSQYYFFSSPKHTIRLPELKEMKKIANYEKLVHQCGKVRYLQDSDVDSFCNLI